MRRKILFITSLFPSIKDPAEGSFIFEQIKLISKENDVKIIVEKKYEVGKKMFLKLLFSAPKMLFYNRVDTDFSNPDFNIIALQYPFFTFYIPGILQFHFIKNSFIKMVKNIIKDQHWKPDLIHSHYLLNSGILAHQISKKFNVPYFVTEHNPVYFNNDFWSEHAKKAYINSVVFFVVSHHEYRRFLTYNLYKKPYILHNFADDVRFVIKRTEPDTFTVLYVGYPHPLKGMKALFEIITELKNKGIRNIVFKILSPIVNTIDFPNGLISYIEEHGLSEYCELLPRRHNTDMPELYQKSNILLSTSINETFGMSILEGLMCGIPVVSTKSGGPEDFLNENNSLMFQIGDINGMAEAIISLKNKSKEFNFEKIRSTVFEKFNSESFIKKYQRILTKYL
jgi:glycosyltransferase involved in cell wall biosynthesis